MALGGILGVGQGVLLLGQLVELVLRDRESPSPPCFLPLSSACVAHTDGNNFFQLLTDVGETRSLQCKGASVACPPSSCAGCGRLLTFRSSPHAISLPSFPPLPLCAGGLAFSSPVFPCPLPVCPPTPRLLIICPGLAVWWERACKLRNKSILCLCMFMGLVYCRGCVAMCRVSRPGLAAPVGTPDS